jgi:predicted transposase YbfD/YdcC
LSHCRYCQSNWEAEPGSEDLKDADISELSKMLSLVPEFRKARGREYALPFILAVCVVAVLAGAKNYREIATVAASISPGMLRRLGAKWDYFERRYKYPGKTTVWYVLTNIDAAELDRITGTWILAQARKNRDGHGGIQWAIAMDGKVMRGSWTDENDQVALFSAMLQEEGFTIAQVRVPDGTNEFTQVEALARECGIEGGESVLATFDAGHCSKETAKVIGGKPMWDYLITIKADKIKLYSAAAEKLAGVLGRNPDHAMTDRSRGVYKVWSCWITDAGGIDFPHIGQVACILREVFSLSGEKISKEVAIQATSAMPGKMSAADMNRHTRNHWVIENKSHYVRDTVFQEDRYQGWAGNGPQAIASLHNLAISLFRMKGVKSIKEATELIHMDRTLAFAYLATGHAERYAVLPPNGPGSEVRL